MTMQITLGFCPFATDETPSEGGAWDEVYYTTGTDIANTMANWLGGVFGTPSSSQTGWVTSVGQESAIGSRLKALASSCQMYYARFALLGDTKKSKLVRSRVRGRAGLSFNANVNKPADINATAFAFRCADNDGRGKRTLLLRGIPDAYVQGGVLTDEGEQAVKQLLEPNYFLRNLVYFGGAIYRRVGTQTGGVSAAILSAEQAGQNVPITITTDAAFAFPAGGQVDIVGVNLPALRGRWTCIGNPGLGKLTLRGSQRYSCPPDLVGRVIKVAKESVAIDPASFAFVGVTSKRTGKKKFQPRGRQSATLIRR